MTGKELSVATGLPKLPDNRYFQISRDYDVDQATAEAFGGAKYVPSELKKPTGNAVITLRERGMKEVRRGWYNGTVVMEEVKVPRTEYYTGLFGKVKSRVVQDVEQRPVMENYDKILQKTVAPSFNVGVLRTLAQDLIDAQTIWETEEALLGDYPPHKLED